MPAPTALLRAPDHLAAAASPAPAPAPEDDENTMDTTADAALAPSSTALQPPPIYTTASDTPVFAAEKTLAQVHKAETRKVPVPPHRLTPLKNAWPQIYPPLVEHLKLQCRMNVKSRTVELRTSGFTTDSGALQKGDDFVRAFTLGFDTREFGGPALYGRSGEKEIKADGGLKQRTPSRCCVWTICTCSRLRSRTSRRCKESTWAAPSGV